MMPNDTPATPNMALAHAAEPGPTSSRPNDGVQEGDLPFAQVWANLDLPSSPEPAMRALAASVEAGNEITETADDISAPAAVDPANLTPDGTGDEAIAATTGPDRSASSPDMQSAGVQSGQNAEVGRRPVLQEAGGLMSARSVDPQMPATANTPLVGSNSHFAPAGGVLSAAAIDPALPNGAQISGANTFQDTPTLNSLTGTAQKPAPSVVGVFGRENLQKAEGPVPRPAVSTGSDRPPSMGLVPMPTSAAFTDTRSPASAKSDAPDVLRQSTPPLTTAPARTVAQTPLPEPVENLASTPASRIRSMGTVAMPHPIMQFTAPAPAPDYLFEAVQPLIEPDDPLITAPSSQAAATASAGTMIAPRSAVPQVAAQIATAALSGGGGTTEIALNPEELGRVRITLTTGEAGLSVSIIAERPETADLMRRNLDLLIREFHDLGHDNLSFSFGEQADNADGSNPTQRLSARAAQDDHAPETLVTSPTAAARGGLDLKL